MLWSLPYFLYALLLAVDLDNLIQKSIFEFDDEAFKRLTRILFWMCYCRDLCKIYEWNSIDQDWSYYVLYSQFIVFWLTSCCSELIVDIVWHISAQLFWRWLWFNSRLFFSVEFQSQVVDYIVLLREFLVAHFSSHF